MFYVYLLACRKGGTLYAGVTNDLLRRVYEHRSGAVAGFTRTYGVHRLVYFEASEDLDGARLRERQLKKWNRAWKIRLIEEHNPDWIDLPRCRPNHRAATRVRAPNRHGAVGECRRRLLPAPAG